MKYKVLFLVSIFGMLSIAVQAQRGVRIGYIDTEYILQNVPEYNEATSQLEQKVQKWKSDVDQRLAAVNQKKKELENERVLLTKELYEERQEDISFEEKEVLDYQQKRFGPSGDLMIQRRQLMQPVQDQIFTAVQEIAKNKKYDFVFDKSADVVMLYSADRFDISEQVLRTITRSSKRSQAKNKKERKEAENESVVPVVNLEKEAKEKAQDEKMAARQKVVDDKRESQISAREAKKLELEAKKKKIIEDRAKVRQAKLDARNKAKMPKVEDAEANTTKEESIEYIQGEEESKEDVDQEEVEEEKTPPKAPELTDREKRKQTLEAKKQKIIEARRKKLEERIKAKEAEQKETPKDSIDSEDNDNNN
jgi:Skp family chaperone for outer membrane proteins